MYPNIKYSDLTDRDLQPHARMSGLVAVGYLNRLKGARLMGALALHALTNTTERKLWVFVLEKCCRCVQPFQSIRSTGRSQSRLKAKRK